MFFFIYLLRNYNSSQANNYDILVLKDKVMLWWLTAWLMALFIVMVWKLVDFYRLQKH